MSYSSNLLMYHCRLMRRWDRWRWGDLPTAWTGIQGAQLCWEESAGHSSAKDTDLGSSHLVPCHILGATGEGWDEDGSLEEAQGGERWDVKGGGDC